MELPDDDTRREIVRRWARLLARFGREIGERPLVLPNGEFFPDTFEVDTASYAKVVRRMQGHAGLGDVPLRAVLIDDAEGEACGTGGCGTCAPKVDAQGNVPRLVEEGDGWLVQAPVGEAKHPVAMTTGVARALGTVLVLEASEPEEKLEAPLEVTAELAAVASGLGLLLLEGAHVYSKSCGGPSVTKLTKLGAPELAIATALFISAGGHKSRRALAELSTTQQALLGEALEWADSNRVLVAALRDRPGEVARSKIKFSETKPWLLRLFGAKPKPRARSLEAALAGDASLEELESLAAATSAGAKPTRRDGPRDARSDEIRRLVDEAFDDADSTAE